MSYCGKCGTQLIDGMKFCPKCGSPVKTTQPNTDSCENSLRYSIELISSGPALLQTTKILMDLLGIEMREAKDIINSTPSVLVTGISLSRAEEIAQMLQNIGAEIEIKQSKKPNIVEKSSQNVVKQCPKPLINEQPLQYNNSLTEESSNNIWEFVGVCVICFLVLCFIFMKCVGNDSSNRQSYSSSSTRTEQKQEQKKELIQNHEFFENGYKYSTSFRVSRKQGYGISCNYQYVIRIYNDGTKEISTKNQTDDGSPSTQGTNPCKINKKSESYKDVYAKWYEVTFDHGTTLGGKYCISSNTIYVDENGNIIMLHENGNNKNIQEAISTKDCVFGKFRKERLTKESYTCRTCGKEYDPSRENIYSEEYCWEDYPLTCDHCGKNYTIRQERQAGSTATNNLCGRCYEKWQSAKIVEHALRGR